jgi:hypothetical protein
MVKASLGRTGIAVQDSGLGRMDKGAAMML